MKTRKGRGRLQGALGKLEDESKTASVIGSKVASDAPSTAIGNGSDAKEKCLKKLAERRHVVLR